MKKLLRDGYKAKLRPSGHEISENFSKDNKGAIPPNLLELANTDSNSNYLRKCREHDIKPHPARFPHGLPAFFIKFLTEPGDLVIDPFAGSNIAGEVAEGLGRHWLAFELLEEYLDGSRFRFPSLWQQPSLFSLQVQATETEITDDNTASDKVNLQPRLLETEVQYEPEPEDE
jgi:site-specific DNA-methyltransferase (cytosine-N4-specific)